MSYEITISLDERRLISPAEQLRRIARGLKAGVLRAERIMQAKLRVATTKGPVYGRTGTLARSWGGTPIELLAERIVGGVKSTGKDGARVPYADILDEGGTIKPHGKYLAIPIFDALTEKGAVRQQFAAGPSQAPARTGQKMFFFRGKSGKLFFGAQVGKKIKAYFVMKEQVRIEGRHYKREAMEAGRADAVAAVRAAIAQALGPAEGGGK